jgi:hypothetical protein
LISLALSLTGCSNSEEEMNMGMTDSKILQGKVLKKESNELWIEPVSDLKRWGDMVIVGFPNGQMTADAEEGQIVDIWYDYIKESDPPQTNGLKIEVVD